MDQVQNTPTAFIGCRGVSLTNLIIEQKFILLNKEYACPNNDVATELKMMKIEISQQIEFIVQFNKERIMMKHFKGLKVSLTTEILNYNWKSFAFNLAIISV